MRIAESSIEESYRRSSDNQACPRTRPRSASELAAPRRASLGQLALHVASLPRQLTEFVAGNELDFGAAAAGQPAAESRRELIDCLVSSIDAARIYLNGLSDERATETWRLVAGDRLLFAAPRAAVLRSFLFNHWYHHRGQLLVYFRLLDVPVPSVYRPTADENPFAGGV